MSRTPIRGGNPLPLSTWWSGGRVTGQGRTTPGTIRAALARQRVRTIPKIPILTNLPPRPLSSPHPRPICPSDGSGRCKTILQRRAAPGSARQRQTGTDGPAACGGAAVPAPQAWDHVRSHAVPLHLPLPLAPAHVRSGAASLPLAPPGQPGPASADRSVLRSTDLWPAPASRPLQAVLPRVPATSRHLDCPPAHHLNRHSHASRSTPRYEA